MTFSRADAGFGPRFALPLLVAPALNSINTTMIAVALVPIARATQSSSSEVILLVAGLYLASAVAQPTMGALVDLYGPKKTYLSGMTIAAFAGLIPLVFPTFAGALTSRIIIGIGTSAAYPAAMTLIKNQSARLQREPPKALFSGLSISSLTSAAVGPVLGGVLVTHFGWQSIFVVNTPYALVAVALALLGLPSDSTHVRPMASTLGSARRNRLDLLGIALFALGIGAALTFVLGIWPGQHWLIAVAVICAVALFIWERRQSLPFLDFRMLAANPALIRTYARLFLVYTCTYLVVYGLSQWLQSAAGYTADAAGWMQFPAIALAGVGAAVVSRTRGIRIPLLVAASLPILGGLLLTFITEASPLWILLVALAVFGPPQGLSAVSNQVALYAQAPAGRTGSAAGMSRTSVQIGAIVASSIIGPILGADPSDADLHVIGWLIAAFGGAALLLTVADRDLGHHDD